MIVILLLMVVTAIVESAALPHVTSPFGWRSDPINGEWEFHTGVDFGLPSGAPVAALFNGVVVDAGNNGDGYGNQVLLYHPELDAYTRYAHCSVLYAAIGQLVNAGETIALVGNTGRSNGPHLHLELIVHTEDGYQYQDPLTLWGD